ncbi:hypothetical protein NDU88_000482 [Pleurodeles waltl]|uniref:Uncharacterized protein n=1 Tax=Pleurodeles waltl TaxID=8319 RepID=A0AAV7LAA5_PLEWA|nr:hypothetical protein NDU88_000482 [Pleurodeles waltl]
MERPAGWRQWDGADDGAWLRTLPLGGVAVRVLRPPMLLPCGSSVRAHQVYGGSGAMTVGCEVCGGCGRNREHGGGERRVEDSDATVEEGELRLFFERAIITRAFGAARESGVAVTCYPRPPPRARPLPRPLFDDSHFEEEGGRHFAARAACAFPASPAAISRTARDRKGAVTRESSVAMDELEIEEPLAQRRAGCQPRGAAIFLARRLRVYSPRISALSFYRVARLTLRNC